jgi:GntR family transcriptional repressor for pyruvate dehydrogenase complex
VPEVSLRPQKTAMLVAQRIVADIHRRGNTVGDRLPPEREMLEVYDVGRENKRFHDIIAHGSGNELFGYLVDALLGMLDGSAIGIDYPEIRRRAVHKAHSKIYEAIASRDPSLSSEVMTEHISEYLKYAERKFPQLMDAPVSWVGAV